MDATAFAMCSTQLTTRFTNGKDTPSALIMQPLHSKKAVENPKIQIFAKK